MSENLFHGYLMDLDGIQEIDGPMCIFISDMSGFTRLVKKLGPIHYTSLIMKMRKLSVPVLQKYGVYHFYFEADNIWALFRDPVSAVQAAREMLNLIGLHNQTVKDPDFRVKLSGVGLHYGDGIVKDNEGKFFGKCVSVAFKMGEDLCEDSEILVSDKVYEIIKLHDDFKNETFTVDHCDEYGGFDCYHYRNFSSEHNPHRFELHHIEKYYEGDNPINEFLSRLEPGVDVVKLDQTLSIKYEQEDVVSVMFGVEWNSIIEKYNVLHMIKVQNIFLNLLRTVFESKGGRQMSSLIFFFNDAKNAVEACIEARRQILEDLNKKEETNIPLKGFGLHVGKVLVVDGTDVLFGDPINSSSKLGEDIAEGEEINLTDTIFNLVSAKEHNIGFTPKVKEISNVTFNYYSC